METKKGFVHLTQRPRPDHPTEARPLLLREDLISMVLIGNFVYEPDPKAGVALLPNAKVLTGEATYVVLTTGAQFVVAETVDDVLQRIKGAREGDWPVVVYEPPAVLMPPQPKLAIAES